MAPPGARAPVAIFVSFSGQGGVERMVLNLADGIRRQGHAVDLVLVKARGAHAAEFPAGVRVVHLDARHTWSALPALMRYLRSEPPAALLAAKDRAIRVAVVARAFAGARTRLVGRLGTTVSAALEGRGWVRRRLWYLGMRLFYRHADCIVAVSQGVADDLRAITGLPAQRVPVVRNPVITPALHARAAEPSGHPWLDRPGLPVIVAAGRLTRQKDFPTLLRAFARVRAARPCRLVVLGEGKDRAALERLAQSLGIDADFALPGFVGNPHSYTAKAALFVLSSAWEGSPNALTEALALGVPVVATDCPSGPREILAGGRYGRLVAVGDDAALAAAILDTLAHPLPAQTLKEAVREYGADASARCYLEVLGLGRHA